MIWGPKRKNGDFQSVSRPGCKNDKKRSDECENLWNRDDLGNDFGHVELEEHGLHALLRPGLPYRLAQLPLLLPRRRPEVGVGKQTNN